MENEKNCELTFSLPTTGSWPPISVEGIAASESEYGYTIEEPPLFVKGLSVGDIISPHFDDKGNVEKWDHLEKSKNSTVWLLEKRDETKIELILNEFHKLGCFSVQLKQVGAYSINVPSTINFSVIDDYIDTLDKDEIAIAFPSFRHSD